MKFEDHKVDVPEGISGGWRVEHFEVTEREASFEQLRSSFHAPYREPPPAGQYTKLMHNGFLVMSDTPAEIRDHWYAICIAKGNVLINGLGLGVVVQAMLNRPQVKHLTVIEISPDVIALVGSHYKTRYASRLDIIEADALTWKPPKGVRYDVVWHDIWSDICSDNLPEIHKLHRKYGRRADWQDSWCRAECEIGRGAGY